MTYLEKLLKQSAEIREKATPGPWKADTRSDAEVHSERYPICYIAGDHEKRPANGNDEFCRGIHEIEDAKFIVHARDTSEAKDAMLAAAVEALHGLLSTMALDWYVSQFEQDTSPSGLKSGIVAKIHNKELCERISIALQKARSALEQIEQLAKEALGSDGEGTDE